MAKIYYTGQADLASHVLTNFPNYDVGTTYSIYDGSGAGGVLLAGPVVAAGSSSATALALKAIWDASTNPYVAGITVSESSGRLTFTGTAGTTFSFYFSASGASGDWDDTSAGVVSTAGSGPAVFTAEDNWWNEDDSAFEAPSSWSSGDIVYIRGSDQDILFGFETALSANLTFHFDSTFTGAFGLNPSVVQTGAGRSDTSTGAREYRATSLVLTGTSSVIIGEQSGTQRGSGSGRIKVVGTTNTLTVKVLSTAATSFDGDQPPVRVYSTDDDSLFYIYSGSVGFASDREDESPASYAAALTLYEPVNGPAPSVLVGGLAVINTITVNAGSLIHNGSGNISGVFAQAGTFVHQGSGTISALIVNDGDVDLTQSTVTVTDSSVDGSGRIIRNGRQTFTNQTTSNGNLTISG